MEKFNFAAEGWQAHADDGFLKHVGPIWECRGEAGLLLAFQAEEKHANLRGVVHGGMLMTLADRLLGMQGRLMNGSGPQATIHLDVHFLSPVRIGDVVIGSGRVSKNTRSVHFVEGELSVAGETVALARGVWKKLHQ